MPHKNLEDYKNYRKQYLEKNKDKIREQQKKYRESHAEEISAWQKSYREKNKSTLKSYNLEYKDTQREKLRARQREYVRRKMTDPEHRKRKNEQARVYRLKHFGLTPLDFDRMMDEQEGVCAVCKRPPTGRALNIDHEHQRQEKKRSPESRKIRVRGLLCHRCNRALGLLGNDPHKLLEIIENLTEYIVNYYSKRMVDSMGAEEAKRLMENTVSYLERFEKRLQEHK